MDVWSQFEGTQYIREASSDVQTRVEQVSVPCFVTMKQEMSVQCGAEEMSRGGRSGERGQSVFILMQCVLQVGSISHL
jgi:hypothetical protein